MSIEKEKNYKMHIVLDNIRSAFNVGNIFRTADAVGNCHIYLTGITSQIDNSKIFKTALGSTESVPSSYHPDPYKIVSELKEKGIPIYSIELTPDAQHFQKVEYPEEVVLIFGHEIRGVNETLLSLSQKKIFIPMKGIKESLNVSNSAAIMMYEVARGRI